MQIRVLDQSGLHVSAIGLGCMMFGWRADSAEVERILEGASVGGINFIDTLGSYGRGAGEELLGAALKRLSGCDEFIIATKSGLPSEKKPGRNATRNSRHNVIRQCELSLKRLQVSHIDLLQIHRASADVPIDATLWAVDLLVR